MKKTMIALAAVLAAGMMYGDVVSENVVGYQTFEPDSSGIVQLGVTFKNLSSQDGSFALDASGLFGRPIVDGDIVLLLDRAQGAFAVYYFNEGEGLWDVMPVEGDSYSAASIPAQLGDALYIIPVDGLVMIAGEVQSNSAGAVTVTFDPSSDETGSGMLPIANPFPVATKFSDLTFAKDGDLILVLNVAGDFDVNYCIDSVSALWMFISSETGEEVEMLPSDVLLGTSACGYLIPDLGIDDGVRTWVVAEPM